MITAKDFDGRTYEIAEVEYCEHCGEVPKQWGTRGSTTWCNICSDANGIDVDALRKKARKKQ